MNLLQALIDGSISANWVFGIIVSVLGFLIWYNLKEVKEIIKKHDQDIQDLKLQKADSETVEHIKEKNAQTIREFDKAVADFTRTMEVMHTKFKILNMD